MFCHYEDENITVTRYETTIMGVGTGGAGGRLTPPHFSSQWVWLWVWLIWPLHFEIASYPHGIQWAPTNQATRDKVT